ncbi:MAG: GNAT family N-acetyltransferase [Bacteroidia bacterium]
MECRWVEFGSEAYFQALALRDEVLRKPLGLSFDPESLALEKHDTHLVGLVHGVVVACCILTAAGPDAKMRQVAVSFEKQGQKLGRSLVEFSEQKAREMGFKRMVLHARMGAVPFYQRLGYSIDSEEFIEVGIPHRSMSKLVEG